MAGKSKGIAGTSADKRKRAPGNLANLKPTMWKPGQSGNPQKKNMRGKNTKYLRNIGYNQGEINDAIVGMLAMTLEELELFSTRPDATVLEKTIGKALLTGAQKGTLWNLDTLLNRAHGLPKASMELEEKKTFNVTLNLGGQPNAKVIKLDPVPPAQVANEK